MIQLSTEKPKRREKIKCDREMTPPPHRKDKTEGEIQHRCHHDMGGRKKSEMMTQLQYELRHHCLVVNKMMAQEKRPRASAANRMNEHCSPLSSGKSSKQNTKTT
jgi:hypothetical protein